MENKTRLLLCEDDRNLGSLLAQYLKAKDYDVELCTNGEDGWKAYRQGGFDLLLLDVMMPIKDGFTLARQIRADDLETPIIFLTAKNMKRDTLEGFESGADDYITKPFSMEELLLRITAVLKRSRGLPSPEEEVSTFLLGGLLFDARKQTLVQADAANPKADRALTTKETALLLLLCQHRNSILLRSEALRAIWGEDNYFNGRSMDVYIAKLRKYLADEPGVEIVNVHGKGFRLVAPET
jgi:DNA-binding response OmpR family regulator